MSDPEKPGSTNPSVNSTDCPQDCEDCKEEQIRAAELGNAEETDQNANTPQMDECLGRSLEQLSTAFSASARRWELIVYPSLVAFIILAAYGFYLVYSLTKDVSIVANNMTAITESMQNVAKNVDSMSGNMVSVSNNMEILTTEVKIEAGLMADMVVYMRSMNGSMQGMIASMDQMRYHVA